MTTQYTNIKPFVIGIGIAGRRHLEAQLNLGYQTGVYTSNPITAQQLRKEKKVILFDNLEEGIGWANLVHVCTPDDKHTEFVTKALKRSKAVLCEKALTTNLEEAIYLQKLAHDKKTLLCIGQNYRLTPTFLDIRKRVMEGEIGSVSRIETAYFHDNKNYLAKYTPENFLYAGGSHAIDLAQWIINQPIVSVQATANGLLTYNIDIRFSLGTKGNVKLDASSQRGVNGTSLSVFGEKGQLSSHNKAKTNIKILTTPLEVKILDNYLLGKTSTFWPIPAVDEAISVIKVLDAIQRSISSKTTEEVLQNPNSSKSYDHYRTE